MPIAKSIPVTLAAKRTLQRQHYKARITVAAHGAGN